MPATSASALRAEAARLDATAREAIASAADLDSLAAVRARLVGKQGEVKALQRAISGLPREERPVVGAEVNQLAQAVEGLLDARRAALEAEMADGPPDPTFDPTFPGVRLPGGSLHPVTLVLEDIRAIFTRLGFDEVSGPEVEDAWHNFDALNIPSHHPARSPQDNFYVEGGRLLRSQTSTVQVRVMESREPPLRVFAPGRVYRPETVDARHLYAFHQVEGLMVGEGVTFADLKDVTVVQLCGNLGAPYSYRPDQCTMEIARRLNAKGLNFYAPLILSTEALAAALRAEPVIREQLAGVGECDMALFSVGFADEDAHVVKCGAVTAAELRALRRQGAVGVIAGQMIDAGGAPLDCDYNRRCISADLADFRAIPKRLMVVQEEAKLEPLRAALAGRFATHLVVSRTIAQALIDSPAGQPG